MKVGLLMQKLYDDLRNKVEQYKCEDNIDNENALIKSLDTLVNAKSFDSIIDSNEYRNKVLILLNEDLYDSLMNLPDDYMQFEILLHQFFNKRIINPIKYLSPKIKFDLERDDDDENRKHTVEEWESMLDYASKLAVFWDGKYELSVSEIYNNIFKSFPRMNFLKYLDYGLNPQHLKDLDESLGDTLESSSYIEDAEDSLLNKIDIQQIYQLKYFEPNVYAGMLSDEITFLQTGIEFMKTVNVDDDSKEVVF